MKASNYSPEFLRGFIYPVLLGVAMVVVSPVSLAENLKLSLLTELEYLDEMPTIVTASRMPQPQSEAPAAVTVIDAEMIKASGVRNIVDLLRYVPGFQIGNFNSAQAVVTYHGLSDQYPRHMQVLVDGRSVYSPMFRGAFWSDLTIAIEDIERIEVIRGPNTVTYGSNAFFGVINIITKHASQESGTLVKGVAGNNGIRDATIRHAWRVGEQSFRITGGWRQDSGFETRIDDVKAKYLDFSGDLRLGPRDALEINTGINQNFYVEDFPHASVPISPTERKVTSHYQQLRWRRAGDQFQELGVQFFHQHRDQTLNAVTDPYDLTAYGLGVIVAPLSFNATEDRYDLEFQHNLHPGTTVQLVWGGSLRLDEMRSKSFFADDEIHKNRVRRLFSNVEWHALENLVLNAGAIYEDSDVAGSDVSPRLAVNYHFIPGHTLRASLSKATRMPALIEEEGSQQFWYQDILFDQTILGTQDLVTEKISTRELAYLGRFDEINLSLGLRLYRDLITDRITEITVPALEFSPEGEAYSFANTGKIEVVGQEFELDYRPVEQLRVLFNYAQMDAKAYDFDPAYDLGQRTSTIERSVPEYSVHSTIIYRFLPDWQASMLAGRTATMEWLGDGDYIGGQNRVDLNLSREMQFAASKSRLALTVQWAGGKYTDFRYVNVTDRRYFLTFEMQF